MEPERIDFPKELAHLERLNTWLFGLLFLAVVLILGSDFPAKIERWIIFLLTGR